LNAYVALKAFHTACAIASGCGFVARYLLMLLESPRLGSPLARVAPHVVDTLLLASAVTLAWLANAVPLRDDWLTAKIGGLLLYIAIGSIALKRGRTKVARAVAGVLAITIFAYIASVALTKSPYGLLARLALAR